MELPQNAEFANFASKKEARNHEEHVIRGHHILFYRLLFAGMDPVMVAKETRKNTEEKYEASLMKYLGALDRGEVPAEITNELKYREKYKEDVLGKTPEEAQKVQKHDEEVFKEFLSLPPEHPIILVAEKKGRICEGCNGGAHCITKTKQIKGDGDHIDTFIQKATSMNLKFTQEDDIAYFSNAPSENVKRVKTTVGTLQKVLESSHVRDWR